jgi:hypothetical protein
LRFLESRQTTTNVQISLTLIAAEIEYLKGPKGLLGGLSFTLNADQPLTCSVDAELSQVGRDPFAPEFFRYGGCRP